MKGLNIVDLQKADADQSWIHERRDSEKQWPETYLGIPIRVDPNANPDIITIEKRVFMDPLTIENISQKVDQLRKENPELYAHLQSRLREYADQCIRELAANIRR